MRALQHSGRGVCSLAVKRVRVILDTLSPNNIGLPINKSGLLYFLTKCAVSSRVALNPPPGGGGGTQQSFIREGSTPRSKPLPIYVPFLIEKVPLLHASHRKWYPFHIPSWGFKIFCPFQIPKWQFSLPFPILELVKSLPFHIPPA